MPLTPADLIGAPFQEYERQIKQLQKKDSASSGVSWFQNQLDFQVQVSTCPNCLPCDVPIRTSSKRLIRFRLLGLTLMRVDTHALHSIWQVFFLHPRQLKKSWKLQSQSTPLVQSAQQQKPRQKPKLPLVRDQRRSQQSREHCQLQATHLSSHHLQRNQLRRTKWTPQGLHAGWASSPLTQTRASKLTLCRRRLCFLWFPKLQC